MRSPLRSITLPVARCSGTTPRPRCLFRHCASSGTGPAVGRYACIQQEADMRIMLIAIASLVTTALALPLTASAEDAAIVVKSGEHHHHWRDRDHKKVVIIKKRHHHETTGVSIRD